MKRVASIVEVESEKSSQPGGMSESGFMSSDIHLPHRTGKPIDHI